MFKLCIEFFIFECLESFAFTIFFYIDFSDDLLSRNVYLLHINELSLKVWLSS